MSDLTLKTTRFKIKNTIFEIVGTSFGKQGVWNATDTIKNLDNNQRKTFKRSELIVMLDKYKAEFI